MELIRNYRQERAITQADLAREIGVSQPLIGLVETGRREVGKQLALKLYRLDPARFPLEELLCPDD